MGGEWKSVPAPKRGGGPSCLAPDGGGMAIYKAWLPMLADSRRQRLQQTAASIFADDLKRPNRQNSLLAQRESTRIAQRLGSRARGLSPTGLECSWCWQCWSMVEKPWGESLTKRPSRSPLEGGRAPLSEARAFYPISRGHGEYARHGQPLKRGRVFLVKDEGVAPPASSRRRRHHLGQAVAFHALR